MKIIAKNGLNFEPPYAIMRSEDIDMILNVGLRTDIVHHYSDWLFRRFREGFVYARNPLFPSRVNAYTLSPDKVDAVSFCSKNYAPALGRLHEISDSYRTYFFYTITPYGTDLEPAIPSPGESIGTLKELSKLVGREKLVWRYDPVLLTKKYTEAFHLDAFAALADKIAPYVHACIFSFVEMFIRINKCIPNLVPLDKDKKRLLAKGMAEIAARYGLPLKICCAESGYETYGILREGCLTLDELGRANGCRFRAVRHLGNKASCLCIASRDVGWYDSCPSECLYCNANRGIEDVRENVRMHDPCSPLLIGNLKKDDVLLTGVQNSLLMHDGRQISLFDI